MTTLTRQYGFTLVELAIVMTIIGLLIGGILKGQELIQNARATSTIAQIRSFEAATTTFRDTFSALPGDMQNASTRLAGCATNCDPGGSGGNSIIGVVGWSGTNFVNQQVLPSNGGGGPGAREGVLYWLHLLQANLIGGVSAEAMTATSFQLGVTNPAAPIGGGLIVGYADGTTALPGNASTAGLHPTGHIIGVVNTLNGGLTTTAGGQPMSSAKAALIDRKMDDGRPATGFVQAYGVQTSCITDATTLAYNERVTANDCGLVFRIQ